MGLVRGISSCRRQVLGGGHIRGVGWLMGRGRSQTRLVPRSCLPMESFSGSSFQKSGLSKRDMAAPRRLFS